MGIRETDNKHIWHPLTQHGLGKEILPIVRAEGAILHDADGKEYIDGISSWYTCMYGHSNPYITEKVKEGLDQLDQIVFSGFTHPPATQMAEKLVSILPTGLDRVFFSDNGSTSVDVALKMAFQYHFNKGQKRNKVVSLVEGFHGDTFGAMSVSDLSVYNGPFEDFFIDVVRFDIHSGSKEETLSKFKNLISDTSIASFVYEPLVQGAAGMKLIDLDLLDSMISMAKEAGVICIADEVMTGFGKTGTYFASDQLNNKPDIICLSKSLTAGIAPMAVTVCTTHVYSAFLSTDVAKGFFHGHTYSANPLACNAASAAMDLLVSDEIQNSIRRIEQQHKSFSNKLQNHPKVLNARTIGVILAFEVKTEAERYGSLRDKLYDFYMKNGVFLRPLGSTIYMLPSFVISDEQLEKLYSVILESLEII